MFDFLRPSVPMSKSFMRIPRISGTICGIWPQRKHSCIKFLLFGFNVFAVALGAVGENLYGFVYLNDLVNALEAFCPGVTKAITLFKMLIFFVFNHRWYTIVQRIHTMLMTVICYFVIIISHYFVYAFVFILGLCILLINKMPRLDISLNEEQQSKEKMKIVQKLASIASIFSFILLASGTFTNISFSTRPLVLNMVRHFRGQDIKNVLPFNVVIPEMFVNYPYYPVTYLILTLSGAMTVFTFSFVDGFFVCACMYMSGIFRMIQHDIRIIFADLKEYETTSLAQNQRIRLQLTAVVKRHNDIIDLCSYFAANFTLIILMHFLSAALVLCLSLLDLMLNSASLGILVYIFYSIAALTQLFLYCIGGSYISESSAAIADTLYDIEWYKCDVKTRKMILMMLRRSQKVTTIVVPFFTPSLTAFSSILSTTGSYIALLKTFL